MERLSEEAWPLYSPFSSGLLGLSRGGPHPDSVLNTIHLIAKGDNLTTGLNIIFSAYFKLKMGEGNGALTSGNGPLPAAT